ncbi:hypothetical protein Aperf_G00000067511 [Anoplocephala perfoliata]
MNLSLIQILEVDEKRQIITTNVWVNLDWKDHNFIWNPEEYGNVTSLLLPSENIWTPDLALYNNAGGHWDLASSSSTKVVVNHDGTNCSMKIGCWTHHGLLIDLRHTSQRMKSYPSFDNCRSQIDHAIDLSMFTTDVQWDLIGVSARRNIEYYPCCPEPYLDISFYIVLRRKPLFFGVNVICPCISISILTVLVFYLPADSREKISLSISTLIALTVFFLLVFEISPPTSLLVPLIAKFLLFTMILIILSTAATVVVLNIATRSPDTHRMPPIVRKIFIESFPKLLLIKRYGQHDIYQNCRTPNRPLQNDNEIDTLGNLTNAEINFLGDLSIEQLEASLDQVRKLIGYFRRQKEWNRIRSEWKYVAFVIDRLLLWLFTGVTAIGIILTFAQAPTLAIREKVLSASSTPPSEAINVTRLSCETKLI